MAVQDLAGFHAQAQKKSAKVVLIALRRWVSLVTRKHANCRQLADFSVSEHEATMSALTSTYEKKLTLMRERQALLHQIASDTSQTSRAAD